MDLPPYPNVFMKLEEYIIDRLLNAHMTSYQRGNDIECICTEDGLSRISKSHTLECNGAMTFSNSADGKSYEYIKNGMVEFYKNSLYAQNPMVADTIICNKDMKTPCYLRRLHWPHESWFIFNSKTGILSDKWWHIYGYVEGHSV